MIERLFHRDVSPPFAQRYHQFDFMLQVIGTRRIGHIASTGNQRVSRLAEKKRRFATVAAHHGDMQGIVLPDAVHAANGETGIRTNERNNNRRNRWNNKIHTASLIGNR